MAEYGPTQIKLFTGAFPTALENNANTWMRRIQEYGGEIITASASGNASSGILISVLYRLADGRQLPQDEPAQRPGSGEAGRPWLPLEPR
jgi:hypothetical protein